MRSRGWSCESTAINAEERPTSNECKYGGKTKRNGNCSKPGADGLPVQCVGGWARDKNFFVFRYIEATRAVRLKYLPPKVGGAAFIDLFAGPGMKRLQKTGVILDGTPLLAAKHTDAPFTRIVACDIDAENVAALTERLGRFSSETRVVCGDCNGKIDEIVASVPPYGLNLALVDPFGLKDLKFQTLQRLAEFKRMDLIVHFPTGDIKRNLGQYRTTERWLDEALGTRRWRERQRDKRDVAALVEVFSEQLQLLGYGESDVKHHPSVRNDQGVPLYYLVYASKHDRGNRIWKSLLKQLPTGQKVLEFD